jgi:hypothetical protein
MGRLTLIHSRTNSTSRSAGRGAKSHLPSSDGYLAFEAGLRYLTKVQMFQEQLLSTFCKSDPQVEVPSWSGMFVQEYNK